MIEEKEIRKIVYALTLKSRGAEKRKQWLERGFKIINRNPNALLNYWSNRLEQPSLQDLALFQETLKEFIEHSNNGGIKDDPTVWGPLLWQDFHSRTKSYDGGVGGENSESEWLFAFAKRIPCHACREHFLNLIKSHPPNFAEYEEWGRVIHDYVNEKLGKPLFVAVDAHP